MTTIHVGIRSHALALPSRVITNEDLRRRFPAAVLDSEKRTLGKLWKPSDDEVKAAAPAAKATSSAAWSSASARFDSAAAPFMKDPFRGCVERRWLAPGEKAIDLEERAVGGLLLHDSGALGNIDALICASFFPDQIDVGNAAFLAKRLGLRVPAWNVESACSGSAIALANACALVHAGIHKKILVVTSCTYSRLAPEDDTLAWGNGDAAAAFVVAAVDAPAGLVAFHAESTNVTCGAIWSTFDGQNLRMHTGPESGRLLRETAEPFLKSSLDGVLSKAKMTVSDVDVFICNTPTAWYTAFCADVAGIPLDKCVNAHPRVANVGPALFPANLELARERGLLKRGARVLVYTVGSVSNAAALVLRWA